jgi:thiamine-phosphate pyrophosphorylase
LTSILARRSWQTADVDLRRQRLQAAHLYLVCDDRPDRFLAAALRGGVDIVQLRMKDGDDDAILAAARRFRAACDTHEALFILNDRPDLAHRADADGVHVGQEDAAVTQARELVGPDRLVGLSTHSPAQIDAAYIGVGPVHATPTKPGRPAVGLELVRYAASHATTAFFAIGGISTANINDVAAAGAERIAVVRALTETEDPARIATELRSAVDRAGARVGST